MNGELCLYHVVPGRCCSLGFIGVSLLLLFISLFFYCKQLSAVAEKDGGSERSVKVGASLSRCSHFVTRYGKTNCRLF